MNKTEVNVYYLNINGLFGRNRKVKREVFSLIEKPFDAPILGEDALDLLVSMKLNDIKLKYGKASVTMNKVTIENDNAIIIRSQLLHFNVAPIKTYEIKQ